jgi:alpha-tubulin suppressor-like RCC1 family protein
VNVFARANDTCATTTAGSLWCFGEDMDGELGDGGPTPSATPHEITTGTDWTKFSLGATYGCGVRSGAVWCWGQAPGTYVVSPPYLAANQATFVDVATTTSEAVCALAQNGDRWCWGNDNYGELGDGRAWATSFAPAVFP